VLRFLAVRVVRRRLERRMLRLLHSQRVRLDRYKFANRAYVKAELLADPRLHRAMEARAREADLPLEVVRRDVEAWVDEIVPAFSFVTYYQLAKRVARWAVSLVYDVAIDRASQIRMAAAIPEGAVPVFLLNHRSNADYVLATHALIRQTALSYAVGEWARVWPVDALFRSFGAYFVRRGFRDPLYHLVLRRYVQLAAKRGVTQGIFPEGRLSRDGALGPAKVGLLDCFVELCLDPDFKPDILLVPVGINFDRVLEDTTLLREARRGKEGVGLGGRLRSLGAFVLRGPVTLAENAVRLLIGRTRRHGAAAVAFGDPISLRAVWREDGVDVAALDAEGRKAWLKAFGARLMAAIGKVVPATPVPIVAAAIDRLGEAALSAERLRAGVAAVLADLRRAGAPIVLGRAGLHLRGVRRRLARDKDARSAETLDVEEALLADEEAGAIVGAAIEILRRRRILRVSGETIAVDARHAPLVRYYAASLARHLAP
jgi:glycerol-3-phosphate O-acyltransferase